MESIIKTISNPVFFTVNNSYPIQSDISLECDEVDIIGVTATVLNQSVECMSGITKGLVRVAFTVLYANEKPAVYESGADLSFEQRDDKIEQNSLYQLKCECEDVKFLVKEDGTITVSAIVEVHATYCAKSELSFLQDIEGAVVKTEQRKVYNSRGCMQATSANFEGEKKFNFEIEKVLCHNDSARLLQTECGIGEIIVDGEILSEFTLLTSSGEIVTSFMTTAFRYEIESEGVSVDSVAFASARLQNANFKISFLNEENASKIDAEYTLNFGAVVLDECAVNCVIDGFSTTHEITVNSENLNFNSGFSFTSYKHKCFGEGICEIEQGEKVVCSLNSRVEILQFNTQPTDGVYKVEGIVYCNLLTVNNQKYKIKQAKIAFDFNIESELEMLDLNATASNVIVRGLEQKCIIDCEIVFGVLSKKCESCNCVCFVEEGEKRATTQSAISVLFISKGDDLWTVCKKALTTEQSILADNPDITFPVASDKAIVVYKSLND
ncbi:MAG: hypothetical protein IKJ19_05590 [Clostridia bacterium]|nr:hypothetical protein [Clostridia bacterium]